MKRALLFAMSGLLLLGAPALVWAATALQVVDEASRPVFVTNPDTTSFIGIICVGAVNAIILGAIWLQLAGIRSALERKV